MLGHGATGQFAIGQVASGFTAEIITLDKWFAALSVPAVRYRRGLRPGQQQFAAADTAVIPIGRVIPWFVPLSEPVRFRIGLKAARQQFLATPSQLRPTPATSGVLDATETKDSFLGSASRFNAPASAEIGIADNPPFAAEIGVSTQGPSGTIASVQISISII